MYCGKCGEKLNENDLFCPNCGTKVEKQSEGEDKVYDVTEQQANETQQQDVSNQSYNVQQANNYSQPNNNVQQANNYSQPNNNVQQASSKPKRKNSNTNNTILICIGVVVVIAILLTAIVFFINTFIFKDDDKKEDNGNTTSATTTDSSITSNSNNSGTITTTSNSSDESTYEVTYGGYTFEIPEKYEYKIQGDKLFVGNTDDDVRWTLALIPMENLTFSQVESNKDYFDNYFESIFETDTTSIDYIGGVNYYIVPFDYSDELSALTGYAELGSSAIVSYEVNSPDEKLDKNILYEISPIIKSAKKQGDSDTTASTTGNKSETRRLEDDEEIEGFESMDKIVKAAEESKDN